MRRRATFTFDLPNVQHPVGSCSRTPDLHLGNLDLRARLEPRHDSTWEANVKTWRAILVALLLWSGEVGVMAQGAAPLAAELVGTWRLTATRQVLSDGTVRPEVGLGPRGVGYIITSDAGRMCAFLSNPDRPKWKSQEAPTDTELRAAFEGVVAYCGTYEVNEPERYVVHHVEMDKYRIWRAPIGSVMSRCRGTDLCSGPRLCRKVSGSGPLSGSVCRTNEAT